MKKIQSICIVALLAAFALTSCNYTDLDPTDMVGPDKAFGNVQNVHKAVVGIYGKASLRSKLAVTEYIADDYRLTLPIPQAEIDANSGISESDQNYGY